jgi:hypothetical protein
MSGKILIFCLLILTALTSCNNFSKSEQEKPVARVYDLYLYPSEIADRIPDGVSQDDSLRLARRLVDEWIREKLLLVRAEQFLSDDQKNVDKQLEEYRSSLLTFKYKQKLLSQNLDTIVNEEELQSFYNENSSNYILDGDVVKVTYVKVPVTAPQIWDVRRWYRSEDPGDQDNLEKYCINFASNYMINSEQWFRFSGLIDATPLKISNVVSYLNYNRNIETSDSSSYYFIHILDRVPEGQVAPLELVRDNIRSVIINKRKIKFMEDLENSVYQDGRAKNKVEIF